MKLPLSEIPGHVLDADVMVCAEDRTLEQGVIGLSKVRVDDPAYIFLGVIDGLMRGEVLIQAPVGRKLVGHNMGCAVNHWPRDCL